MDAALADLEIPPLPELTAAVTALARGQRRKALLPLGTRPLEFALVRRGSKIYVSAYETGSAPEVHQLERSVDLATLLNACARQSMDSAQYETDPTARQIAVRLAERALGTEIEPDPTSLRNRVKRQGGARNARRDAALSFGFEVEIHPTPSAASRASRADVHALLFKGTLWAHVHGRRVTVARGPVLLAAQRMVVAVRALVDALESGRPTNVRLCAGTFSVGIRLGRDERAALTLRCDGEETRLDALRPEEVALPILRLASDLLRVLVSADRTQTRNLRVNALREEVRTLRRAIKQHGRPDGFVNADPERLRLAHAPAKPADPLPVVGVPAMGGVRFEERWRIALDGLDASATYFCGDRLILAGPQHSIAVERGTGQVIWAREGSNSTLMAGEALLRLSPEGDVELCDVRDGEPYAFSRITPRVGGPSLGLYVGGRGVPPMAVFAEGSARLVALDLHTGEPRWRFVARREGPFHVCRAGRLLLVADDNAIHAIDVASGEDVWRFAVRARFGWAPTVVGDCVVAVAEGRKGRVFGVDLYTGESRFQLSLGESPAARPIATPTSALIALADERLVDIEVAEGTVRWEASDPGVSLGAASLVVDDLLITNAPGGGLTGRSLRDGSCQWSQLLGDPIGDEVPRRLEPVLRGGALFVPAGTVHVVNPRTGDILGEIEGDLVPDRLRVDERGWVYVAEESGHVAAYAPAPTLRLIRGGARSSLGG